MSNFIIFSLTVTIFMDKNCPEWQSGVIWPALAGLFGRHAQDRSAGSAELLSAWCRAGWVSQPLAVTLRHNLPSRGWFTLQKSLISCLSLVHVVKKRGSLGFSRWRKWGCDDRAIRWEYLWRGPLCDATLLSFQEFARIKLRVAPAVSQ